MWKEGGEERRGEGRGDRERWTYLCDSGRHWYAQAACMREMGIVCYTVGCGISGNTELVYRTIAHVCFLLTPSPPPSHFPPPQCLTSLAQVTKGLYVNLSDVSLLIPLITGAAETALDRQRLQELLLEVSLLFSSLSSFDLSSSSFTPLFLPPPATLCNSLVLTLPQVVLENLAELQRIDDDESLVAELLKRLRAKNIKLRALSVHTNTMVRAKERGREEEKRKKREKERNERIEKNRENRTRKTRKTRKTNVKSRNEVNS